MRHHTTKEIAKPMGGKHKKDASVYFDSIRKYFGSGWCTRWAVREFQQCTNSTFFIPLPDTKTTASSKSYTIRCVEKYSKLIF